MRANLELFGIFRKATRGIRPKIWFLLGSGQRWYREFRHLAHSLAVRRRLSEHDAKQKLAQTTLDFSEVAPEGPPSEPLIHFLYFTCSRHFPYLVTSVRSLARLESPLVGSVRVHCDRLDPLSTEQLDELSRVLQNYTYDVGATVTGWGLQTLLKELELFGQLGAAVPENHYIAKVDSDVLFGSEDMFRRVVASSDDYLGQRFTHQFGYSYLQGGCYFLRAKLARRVARSRIRKAVLETCRRICVPVFAFPEDAVVYSIATGLTASIGFTDCYFPLSEIDQFRFGGTGEKSIVHFQGFEGSECRAKMLELGRELRG